MTTFVLVHGAWHGSWCWKRVRKLLQGEGHDVFTPTLTGVGERSPTPVNVGVNTSCPCSCNALRTRFQHQLPCQAPCTRTNVAIITPATHRRRES